MANQKQVLEYSLVHYDNGKTRINLYFDDESEDAFSDLSVDRALWIADILRNEKPVYWTEDARILWTGKEPVGEGER